MLLAASLAVSVCATPVFADDAGTVNRGSAYGNENKAALPIVVKYEATKAFEWSVPSIIDFGKDAGVGNTSTVKANLDASAQGKPAEQVSGGTKWEGTVPKVYVTKNVIDPDETLCIQMEAVGWAYKVKTDKGAELSYTVTTGNVKHGSVLDAALSNRPLEARGSDILAVPAGEAKGEAEMNFELETAATAAEIAGTYTGTLNFTASAYTNVDVGH